MDITLKTADQIRQLMPQANVKLYLDPIMQEIERVAKQGGKNYTIYSGSTSKHKITDILSYIDRAENTLAGDIVTELQKLGFIVKPNRGYDCQRDSTPASLTIFW